MEKNLSGFEMNKKRSLEAKLRYFRIVTCRLIKDDRLGWKIHLAGVMFFAFLSVMYLLFDFAISRFSIDETIQNYLFTGISIFSVLYFLDRKIFTLFARHFLALFGLDNLMPPVSGAEAKLANHLRPTVARSHVILYYSVAIIGAVVFLVAKFESSLIARIGGPTNSHSRAQK